MSDVVITKCDVEHPAPPPPGVSPYLLEWVGSCLLCGQEQGLQWEQRGRVWEWGGEGLAGSVLLSIRSLGYLQMCQTEDLGLQRQSITSV